MGSDAVLLAPDGSRICHADLSDPKTFAEVNPVSLWRRLRAVAPVAWQQLPDGRGFWVVTTYAGCVEVLASYEGFTSEDGTMLSMLGSIDPAGGRQMLASDPPRHTALRRPLQTALTRTAQRDLDAPIRRHIRKALSAATREPVWDVGTTMTILPMKIAEAVMGLSLSRDEAASLARWSTMALAPDDPEYAINGSRDETLAAAHIGLLEFFTKEIHRRRDRTVGGDLVGRLLSIRVEGQELRLADLLANCYSLLIGAAATTGHAATAVIGHLATDSRLYQRWAGDPALLRSGVDEVVRWSAPVLHVMRYARRPTWLGEARIMAGDAVTAWLVSANRDEAHFRDPDTFDPARRRSNHLAFGAGPHYCIGALTARIALRVIFEELFRRIDHIESAGTPERLCSNFINGVKHLPVVVRPRPGAEPTLDGN